MKGYIFIEEGSYKTAVNTAHITHITDSSVLQTRTIWLTDKNYVETKLPLDEIIALLPDNNIYE